MHTNLFGEIELSEQDLFELLYKQSTDLTKINTDNQTANRFNESRKRNFDSFPSLKILSNNINDIVEFDLQNQDTWFMPDEYKNMDIEGFLVYQCPKENYDRLISEIQMFRQKNMLNLLRFLKYLVDTLRKNQIVWGVGRGSSVASYCLFLIGVHKIDPIKYKLDIKEFFKSGE